MFFISNFFRVLVVVKVKVPVVAEEKESRTKIIPPLIIIGLILLSSIIGVFYFHSEYNTPDVSNKYNENWFRRNSQASIPRDLLDLLQNLSNSLSQSDLVENNPELNIPEDVFSSIFPNKTVFYVIGRAEPLAWKVSSLTEYIPNSGWRFRPIDLEDYTYAPIRGSYDYVYDVLKIGIVVNTTTKLFLPILLAGQEEILFHDLKVQEIYYPTPPPPSLNVVFDEYKDINSGGGVVEVSSNIGVNMSFEYRVEGISLNESEIASSSGSIYDTRSIALRDEYLSRFITIPRNYMDNHPNVKELADNLYLGPESTVYEQVRRVLTYISISFEMSNETAPSGIDPVGWFVNNGGGSPIYFLYTAALILRYYNIPTRIAVGYIIGDYLPDINMTEFTMSNHLFLWLEVYDGGLGYWVNYNGIPYIFSTETGIPLPKNMLDPTITPIVTVLASQYVYGIPATYINETFRVIGIVPGLTNPDTVSSMIIYDTNISETEPIAVVPFSQSNNSLIAIYNGRYDLIYSDFGLSPDYGIHILKIVIGQFVILKPIALLKRVSISP